MFMKMARAASERSTCHRLNVGAILVQDRSVVAMGYNGAPAGQPHCGGNNCGHFKQGFGCNVIHAEHNAIKRCPRDAHPDEIYVTHSPCGGCASMIITMGIRDVYYEAEYRKAEPLDSMVDMNVRVFRLTSGGYRINYRTGEVERL